MGLAMRRAMVTPTFAAGLGMVILVVLVLPMAKAALRYRTPLGPAETCPSRCGGSGGRPGGLATARPGQKLPSPVASRPPAVATPAASPAASPAGVTVSYRTIQHESSGFLGQLTLHSTNGTPLTGWTLTFGYQGANIYVPQVWRPMRNQDGSVTLRPPEQYWGQPGQNQESPSPQPSGPADGAPGTVTIAFWVSGRQASVPATCQIDGSPCNLP